MTTRDDSPAILQQALNAHRLGQLDAAAAGYRKVLQRHPKQGDALRLLGVVAHQQGHLDKAEDLLRRAIAAAPQSADNHYFLGRVFIDRKDDVAAEHHLARAVELDGRHADARICLGTLALRVRRFAEAGAWFRRALAINPAAITAEVGVAHVQVEQGSAIEALRRFERVLAIASQMADAWYGHGNALRALGRFEEAVSSYGRALALEPSRTDALMGRANAWFKWGYDETALAEFERALAVDPDLPLVRVQCAHIKMQLCDWSQFDVDLADIRRRLDAGEVGEPFSLLSLPIEPMALRHCTERYNAHLVPTPARDLRPPTAYRHARIRVAYVSGDFREHPVSHLLVEPLEHHDRDRFEIIAVALDADRDDPLRRRIKAATDRFLVVDGKTDDEAAQLIRDLEVDVVVDLMGYTGSTRLGVLAQRPAPAQVNFLGFPSTTGAPFIDYIIADPVVVPPGYEAQYSEQVVRLPETYQPNSRRAIAPMTPARAALGLPDNAFVFCAFNNSYKISPDLFTVWMRLLRAIEGSVLWLNIGHEVARRNLVDAARGHGIAPHRVVFADRVAGHPEHLARYRAADLFLDTLYYNAHTTGSDALWAGLPLITCAGATYAARVGASLLASVGLPELVTTSLADYEALALALARDPERLAAVRAKLALAATTSPLFNPARFTRHLEAAYMTMVQNQRAGMAPAGFDVPAIAD